MTKGNAYKVSEALIERKFRMERIDKIEEISINITGKKLSSKMFDELIENTVAELDIKLAQVQEQYNTLKEKPIQAQPLNFNL